MSKKYYDAIRESVETSFKELQEIAKWSDEETSMRIEKEVALRSSILSDVNDIQKNLNLIRYRVHTRKN